MKTDIKFSENVILIDAGFVDKVVTDLKNHFSKSLNKELPNADMALFLECIALEAGIRTANNDIQVLFIYDDNMLKSFTPSNLEKELNNVAFKSNLGEFSLYSYHTSDMTTVRDLYIESLKLVADSADVKRFIAIPDEINYGDKINPILKSVDGKEDMIVFGMNPICGAPAVRWETMGYAVLKALGIKSDEI